MFLAIFFTFITDTGNKDRILFNENKQTALVIFNL